MTTAQDNIPLTHGRHYKFTQNVTYKHKQQYNEYW